MITINIYWQDLSEAMQKKLLKVFGDNCNWDCIPMSMVEIEDEDQHREMTIDSFLGDKPPIFDPIPVEVESNNGMWRYICGECHSVLRLKDFECPVCKNPLSWKGF